MRFAIFASGNGSNFESIVEHVKNQLISGELVCLFTDQESAYVIERAKKHHIPYYVFPKTKELSKAEYEAHILNFLKAEEIELIILAGYMRIIGSTLLKAYPNRILNLHPSLLPNFPGKQGIYDAFHSEVMETGITIHLVDNGIDTGPIIFQKSLERNEEETLEELEKRIHSLEYMHYPKIIADFIRENEK